MVIMQKFQRATSGYDRALRPHRDRSSLSDCIAAVGCNLSDKLDVRDIPSYTAGYSPIAVTTEGDVCRRNI